MIRLRSPAVTILYDLWVIFLNYCVFLVYLLNDQGYVGATCMGFREDRLYKLTYAKFAFSITQLRLVRLSTQLCAIYVSSVLLVGCLVFPAVRLHLLPPSAKRLSFCFAHFINVPLAFL